ncbi:MAG: twin-arginine translocase TatA/TatE family subunit [Anaerolineae bacterium]|nr:twin-arginine translocase TatA/TatE family subunit [Thermoflexales bacterium]MDW8408964.1 twin-arginine translocase TatA/TatE family subunit [Anaerolineae bacterium]
MPHLGPLEIVIILLIIVLLFGVGRIGRIGGELGRGIKEFRKAIQEDSNDKADKSAGKAEDKAPAKDESRTAA